MKLNIILLIQNLLPWPLIQHFIQKLCQRQSKMNSLKLGDSQKENQSIIVNHIGSFAIHDL